MSSIIEDIGPCSKKISVAVGADAIKTAIDRSYNELRNTIALPGFRRGKTPRGLLEKRFGAHVLEDVKKDVVQAGIEDAVKEHKLEIVASPEVEFDTFSVVVGQGLDFSFKVEVKPEFQVPSYDGIEAKRSVAAVSDADVHQVLDRVCERFSELMPLEGEAAAAKDYIFGAMTVTVDGKVELNRDEVHIHAGEDTTVDGIEIPADKSGFVGVKQDEVVTFSAVLGDEFKIGALRGKNATVAVTVKEIKRIKKAAIEDVMGHYGCETPEAMKEKIKTELGNDKAQEAEVAVEEAIIDQLLARVNFAVPESVLNETVRSHVEERLKSEYMQAVYAGQKVDDAVFMERAKTYREEERSKAERNIRAWYLLERIAKKEKIFATEDDVQKKIEEMAENARKTPTQIREELMKDGSFDGIRLRLLEQKVRNFLKQKARIVDEGVR